MMDLSVSALVFGLLFGSIGLGYFIYGKRQSAIVPLVCGIALMVVPYFISSILLLCVVGAALMAVPYFFEI
jgi:hypothetical protein